MMIEMMKWSGLEWDEGPGSISVEKEGHEGLLGPYMQSQRLHIYQKFIKTLVEVRFDY